MIFVRDNTKFVIRFRYIESKKDSMLKTTLCDIFSAPVDVVITEENCDNYRIAQGKSSMNTGNSDINLIKRTLMVRVLKQNSFMDIVENWNSIVDPFVKMLLSYKKDVWSKSRGRIIALSRATAELRDKGIVDREWNTWIWTEYQKYISGKRG